MRSSYKQIIFHAIAFVLFYSGALKYFHRLANRLQFIKSERGIRFLPSIKTKRLANVQILLYHRVNDEQDPFFTGLSVKTFKKQMEYLANSFNLLSLEEAVVRLVKNDVPDNTVVVTFDDGYRDNYSNAFPILKSLSIPATIFLATDAIGAETVIWHDRVFSAFRETQARFIRGFGIFPKTYSLKSVEEKLFAQWEFLKFIRSQDNDERLRWIDWLIEQLEVTDRKKIPRLMLSWDEVRTMQRNKISFGSHTMTHPILSRLPLREVREEILKSKETIETKLSTCVTAFAYPNGKDGDFNETVKAVLREAGYVCALTSRFGSNECGQDLFELRRATPWDQNVYAFALRLDCFKLVT